MRRAILILCAYLACINGAAAAEAQPHCFRVFDALGYSHKSDLSKAGLWPTFVVDGLKWWAAGERRDEMTKAENLEKWVRARRGEQRLLVLDIEEWPVQGKADVVDGSVARLIAVVQRVREAGYAGPIGYYGLAPIRDYWRAARPADHAEHKAWVAENDKMQSLADAVDALFPSLYTFYDDIDGWERTSLENLREARRLARGKPVYPFLWPQYHEANKQLAGQYLPAATWRRQLEFIRRHADGAVLWGGWAGNGPARWDEQAPWWQTTREFMRDKVPTCSTPNPPTLSAPGV